MNTSAGPRLLGPAEVRSLAARLDLRPTKQRGQNFVIDANTVRRIVRESGITADDVVVEVGPGLGSLTLALLEAGGIGHGDRGRSRAGRGTAGHDRRVRPAAGRPGARRTRGRAAGHRAPRPAADGTGRQPALQRLRAGAAPPARPAAVTGAGPGDGAVGGRRPAGGASRLADVRRPVGQGRLVRGRTTRRGDRAQRLLAGSQRRLRPGRVDPARPADHRRHSRAGVRRHRRSVQPAPQDAARCVAGDRRLGRGRRGRSGRGGRRPARTGRSARHL